MEPLNHDNRKVHLISLGCARNRVDSEVMLGTLFGKGWTHCENPAEGDAIIVNTCGFIQSAKEESIETILDCAEYKKTNPNLKLVVTGCLTQRYKKQLSTGLPEVDLFVGTDEFTKLGQLLDQPPEKGSVHAKRTHYLYHDSMPRVNTLAKHSAYVKVAEGCQHNCSFCIIPAIRGKLRSRPIESVVAEVTKLVSEGIKEVNLIAQDLAAYGREKGHDELLPLLKELVKIPDLKWIRMLYVYPENIDDEFLDFFAREDKLVKYLDIPVQHASNEILTKMKRVVTQEELRNTIKKVKEKIPDIAIRTSVMVGFPSESEDDFLQLKEFVKEMRFDHLGCFTYSQEEGTVAGRLPGQLDEETKVRRQKEIMEVQRQVSKEALCSYVGKTLPVLVSGPSKETELLMEGRLSTQAPEVDGLVYINDGPVVPGSIQMVEILESHDYDLVGRVVSES
ncbi:MAG: 30S ribosomal protein S12 methylthiotransferase RimO [Oligoflexales bacterium]|nr:30S ribosomal protein S12 methylthiotransferase RimO [Oligoflexales bacterium]